MNKFSLLLTAKTKCEACVFFLLMLFCYYTNAQDAPPKIETISETLDIVRKNNNKFGVVNSQSDTIIPAIYDQIHQFNGHRDLFDVTKGGTIDVLTPSNTSILPNGSKFLESWGDRIIVRKGSKSAAIGIEGNILLDFIYDEIQLSDSAYIVCSNHKCGFIEIASGKLFIPMIYDEGYAYFRNGLAIIKKEGKYGVIDRKGIVKIPFQFDRVYSDKNEVFAVTQNSKQCLYSFTGKKLSDWYDMVNYDHAERFHLYLLNNKYGYLTREGQPVTKAIFDKPVIFYTYYDFIKVSQDGKLRYLTSSGKLRKKQRKK